MTDEELRRLTRIASRVNDILVEEKLTTDQACMVAAQVFSVSILLAKSAEERVQIRRACIKSIRETMPGLWDEEKQGAR